MPRKYGYSPIGKRCYGMHNFGAKGRTNVIGALLEGELLTVSLFQDNIDSHIFIHWLEKDLLPKLPEKSVIIMDNASFHKKKDIPSLIERAGHTLEYLPTYSPDLNPIEHKWAQAKSKRRKYNCDIESLFQRYII